MSEETDSIRQVDYVEEATFYQTTIARSVPDAALGFGMKVSELSASMMIVVGGIFLLAGIVQGRKIWQQIPPELQGRWRLITNLMTFFLVGYLFFLVILVSHISFPLELVTGPVFLSGALFVFVVINLSKETISRAKAAENDLRHLNETLELRVAERTKLLLESEAQVKEILDSIHAGIIMINAQNHEIYDINSYALAMIGAPKEEVVGSICHKFVLSQDGNCPITDLHEKMDNSERSLIRANGETIPILKSVVPVTFRGVEYFIESFVDISNRKQAEEQLNRYAMELKESYEELQNFAYIVSHDMRAPLVNIKGFSHELTDLLREVEVRMESTIGQLEESKGERITAIFRDEIPEALDFIGTSVSRMDAMIGAILKLSRLGRREIAPEPVSLGQLVNRVLKSMAHQLESGRVIVTVGELPELLTDRTALEQIIGNLLDNAVKYLEPARPGRVEVNAEWGRTEATVHVRDNGRGIAAEEMHKVFEIFCRAGRRDTPGEGMGLAYVKALLKNLNGRIWCESEPGEGTTFSFTIPLALSGWNAQNLEPKKEGTANAEG